MRTSVPLCVSNLLPARICNRVDLPAIRPKIHRDQPHFATAESIKHQYAPPLAPTRIVRDPFGRSNEISINDASTSGLCLYVNCFAYISGFGESELIPADILFEVWTTTKNEEGEVGGNHDLDQVEANQAASCVLQSAI